MMLRLGAVGVASSHLGHFARELSGDARIVRALPVDADASATPAGIEIVPDLDSFIAGLDGVLILTRDGRNHVPQAGPYLSRGLPVFIDKPLACDVDAATGILAAGRVTSFSALRFLPEVLQLASSGVPFHRIRVPADGANPNAGYWFLGIHGAELASAIAGDCQVDGVTLLGGTVIASLRARRHAFELVLDPSASTYEIEHTGGTLSLDPLAAYTLAARQIERFFAGDDVLSAAQMLAPIRLLDAVLARLPARTEPGFANAT